MEKENKVVVNFPEGTNTAEIVIREGVASKQLDPKAPVKVNISGTIGAPLEFLLKRKDETEQVNQKRCHILVNRETLTITLVTAENDEYSIGKVVGSLSLHPKFIEFGINEKKPWEPAALGQFIKMNRSFFPNREENMKLVSDLKSFTATVNASMERHTKENGSMKLSYGQVVNSNLPEAFLLKIPIFKGVEPVEIQVECYATVDGSDVYLQLFSPAANQLIEQMRDTTIDDQLQQIKDVCPQIAIIEQ